LVELSLVDRVAANLVDGVARDAVATGGECDGGHSNGAHRQEETEVSHRFPARVATEVGHKTGPSTRPVETDEVVIGTRPGIIRVNLHCRRPRLPPDRRARG